MDDSSSTNALLIVLLLLGQALLTVAYAALQNARPSDLQEQSEAGNQTAKSALALLDAKSQLFITYQFSSLLISFGIVLVATLQFVIPVYLGASVLSLPVALLVVMLFSIGVMIFGNVLPEAIGSAYALPLLKLMSKPLQGLVLLLSPLTMLMLGISRFLARLSGSDQLVNTVTEEEIMTLVNAGNTGGTIEDEAKDMIFSVLQLNETLAREMMIPRMDMASLEIKTSIRDALKILNTTGYSRIPVYEENIDNIVGLLYAKDILNLLNNGGIDGHSVRDLLRSVHFVPESLPADKLLRDLQSRNVHMAIVVDEYGGTSGLVTIENIMEEIVGDIRDEYDYDEETEYSKNGDDEYLIDAGMDLDDVNELLGLNLDTDENDTLGGFIYQTIGRVPIIGETIETNDLTLKVRSLEGRRIRKVLVKLKPRPQTLSEGSSETPPPAEIADAS